MSFVLEALKKQEAGSDPDAAVSLARAAFQHRRHRLWMVLFGVAMAINVALLVWLLDPMGASSSQPAQAARTGADAAPTADSLSGAIRGERRAHEASQAPGRSGASPIAAPDRQAPELPAGAIPGAQGLPEANAVFSGSRSEAPTGQAPRPAAPTTPPSVTLGDLPADARSRFPGIAFSTHIYSEDAGLRAVVANGKRHTEGDRIRGLEILAITESGVVLAFERYRVEVPIRVDWDSL